MDKNIDSSKNLFFKESSLRSLVKTVAYRVFSIFGTVVLSWMITKDIGKTISITTAIQVFLAVLYYANERFWNKINWGKEIGE